MARALHIELDSLDRLKKLKNVVLNNNEQKPARIEKKHYSS